MVGLGLLLWLLPAPAGATCLGLAQQAERLFGVPSPILQAIVLTESGDNPFALNVAGASVFPKTAAEARRIIQHSRETGANVDIGCGQISLTYHREFFGKSPEMALDPWINVVYMAREVLSGFKREGSWAKAVAVYHSGSPERQRQYLCKVAGHVLNLTNRHALLGTCGKAK